MKSLFPGYYSITKEEIAHLWKHGTFILDANTILNLYRYPENAREDLFKLLDKIADRLWVPNYAALEYQRNRQDVIMQQKERFSKVRKILESSDDISDQLNKLPSRRSSDIDTQKFTRQLKKIVDEFKEDLERIETKHANEVEKDALRVRIENILSGKIGDPYGEQQMLESIYKEGEQRYSIGFPPGFQDADKENEK